VGGSSTAKKSLSEFFGQAFFLRKPVSQLKPKKSLSEFFGQAFFLRKLVSQLKPEKSLSEFFGQAFFLRKLVSQLKPKKSLLEFFGQAFFLRKLVDNKAGTMAAPLETDESAITSLPFRLTVSGILFAVILLLSSIYLYDFLGGAKEKTALDEVSRITAAAEQLSLRGERSEIFLELRLPEGVSVDFGTLPGRQDKWPADANDYCVCTGEKTTFYYSAASFSNPELNGPVSLASGRHRLLLSTKLESKSGRLFVIISEKGALNNI